MLAVVLTYPKVSLASVTMYNVTWLHKVKVRLGMADQFTTSNFPTKGMLHVIFTNCSASELPEHFMVSNLIVWFTLNSGLQRTAMLFQASLNNEQPGLRKATIPDPAIPTQYWETALSEFSGLCFHNYSPAPCSCSLALPFHFDGMERWISKRGKNSWFEKWTV